jgi:hypothetical protein
MSAKSLLSQLAKLRGRLGLDEEPIVLEVQELVVGPEDAPLAQLLLDAKPPPADALPPGSAPRGGYVTRIEGDKWTPEQSAAALQMIRDDPVGGPRRAWQFLLGRGTPESDP